MGYHGGPILESFEVLPINSVNWCITPCGCALRTAHETWGNSMLRNHSIEGMAAEDGPRLG